MKKVKISFFGILLIFLIYSLNMVLCVNASEMEENRHIVIFLDTSGSMDTNDHERTALNWVMDICALSKGTDIKVSIITFNSERVSGDSIKPLIQNVFMDEENIHRVDDNLECYRNNGYSGKYTDHLGALEKMEDIIRAELPQNTTIVMLSDGDLDYVDDETDSKKVEKLQKEESEAIDKFNEKCKGMAAEGFSIFFVGFGNDVNMFQKLADSEDSIEYLSKDKSVMDITQNVYKNNGLFVEEKEAINTDSRISFKLENDYYRSILNLKKLVAGESISKEDINVFFNGNVIEMDLDIIDLSNSAYIYMDKLLSGEYELEVPNSQNEKCLLLNLSKADLDETKTIEIVVSFWDKNGKEIKFNSDEGYYEINNEMQPIKLSIRILEEIDLEEIEKFIYSIGNVENDILDEIKIVGWKGEWETELILPEEAKKYSFDVRLKLKNIASQSERKRIINYTYILSPTPTPTPTPTPSPCNFSIPVLIEKHIELVIIFIIFVAGIGIACFKKRKHKSSK